MLLDHSKVRAGTLLYFCTAYNIHYMCNCIQTLTVVFTELFCSFGLIISNLIMPLIIRNRIRWHCIQKPFVYIHLILDCRVDDKKVDMSAYTYSAEPHHATLCYIINFMGPGGFTLVGGECTSTE